MRTRAHRTVLLLAALAAATSLSWPPAALAGGVSEHPFRDWENGWSIKTILAWESRPPSMPSTSQDARVVGGWYPKDAETESWSVVLAFGRYFGDAVPEPAAADAPAADADPAASAPAPAPPAKPAAPPAPDRFPKWAKDWFAHLEKVPRSKVTGDAKAVRLGPDAGWQWEGKYEITTYEQKWHDAREWEDVTRTWRILAVGGRRGDFEVGIAFFMKANTWDDPPNLKVVRESALSLRFLEAKDMTRRRDELERKAQKAGGGDEAWLVRVRAKIPAGWRHFRRADTVYVYPDGVASNTVEDMAIRLDTIRRRGYRKIFPANVDADAPPAIVKVTRDQRQYLSYGAPESSLGYFSAKQRELVLYYRVADWWNSTDSTSVLFHEGFHQYVNQALDGLSAHPWFEEGFGDWFGGWRMFEGEPRQGVNESRKETMDDILDDDAQLPTWTLMQMEWDPFYGRGPGARNPAITYAQSWSLASFLRSSRHSACVDRYFAALLEGVKAWKTRESVAAMKEGRPVRSAGEMSEEAARDIRLTALEAAFTGVDRNALHEAWLAWARK